MKKIFYLVPLMLLLMVVGAMASYDMYWNCPQSGTSSTNTAVKDYMTYEDDPPYINCQKAGNNFTIEFQVYGTAADWLADEGEGVGSKYYNATLFLYRGSVLEFTLPIADASNFTNTSGTTSDLFRWTDFGELYTSGLVGYPKWYNNLTEGGYKWYILLEENNGTGGGTVTQLLSSEEGTSSGDPVHFTIDHRGSGAKKLVGGALTDQPGTEEAQSILRREGVGIGGFDESTLIILLIIVGIVYYLWKNKKG